MATGIGTTWVADPTDVEGAGQMSWGDVAGIDPGHPLVSSGGLLGGSSGYDVDSQYGAAGSVVSLPGGATGAMNDSTAHDNWRDLFDPHSPAFWVWIFALSAIGLIAFRVDARGGPARVGVGIGNP